MKRTIDSRRFQSITRQVERMFMSIEGRWRAESKQPDHSLETPFYIPAIGSVSRPRRPLKCADTFVVTDSHGDIGASAGDPDGLFHADTRFLSRLGLLLYDQTP